MIKIQNNTATREPLPSFLRGLAPESLLDLSWTDPALGVSDAAWWPEEDQTPQLGADEVYDCTENLTPDASRKVVVVVRGIREMTPQEIRAANPAPTSCTPSQGVVALYAVKGISEDDVYSAINQITDPVQRYTARTAFQRATVWERGSPTMQTMALLLELSEDDLDNLYTFAVTVQV